MSAIFFPTDTAQAKDFSRKAKAKKLRKLFHGAYTDDLDRPLDKILLEHWMEIVAHVVPDGILSFRTALELTPVSEEDGTFSVFVTSTYSKRISLGPLLIRTTAGDLKNFTESVLPNLKRSNRARAIVENLSHTRKRKGLAKVLDRNAIEDILARILEHEGEDKLNLIRDEAKLVANKLKMEEAIPQLNTIVSSLLNSNSQSGLLQSNFASAVAVGESYDSERVTLFQKLAIYLHGCSFRNRKYSYTTSSWKTLSFFESYFSNYIEGTKFLIDEAEDIVFEGKIIKNRHADSHDVSALFNLASDYNEMCDSPFDFERFSALLRERHAFLMKERREKRPGEFKEAINRAGSTVFVVPSAVLGTLRRGFEIYRSVNPGMPRALFIMFLITEVHPFDDGNGRLARLMMNAELNAVEQTKCIIPTVCRDNYLNGLRQATRENRFHLFCKVIDQAQAYTSSIDWSDYGQARSQLEREGADKDPDQGLPQFNRALRELDLSHLPK